MTFKVIGRKGKSTAHFVVFERDPAETIFRRLVREADADEERPHRVELWLDDVLTEVYENAEALRRAADEPDKG